MASDWGDPMLLDADASFSDMVALPNLTYPIDLVDK